MRIYYVELVEPFKDGVHVFDNVVSSKVILPVAIVFILSVVCEATDSSVRCSMWELCT